MCQLLVIKLLFNVPQTPTLAPEEKAFLLVNTAYRRRWLEALVNNRPFHPPDLVRDVFYNINLDALISFFEKGRTVGNNRISERSWTTKSATLVAEVN